MSLYPSPGRKEIYLTQYYLFICALPLGIWTSGKNRLVANLSISSAMQNKKRCNLKRSTDNNACLRKITGSLLALLLLSVLQYSDVSTLKQVAVWKHV